MKHKSKEFIYSLKKFLGIGYGWKEINHFPKWAEKQLPRDISSRYNKSFFIKGDRYRYKYTNKVISQGHCEEHYFIKKRKSKF